MRQRLIILTLWSVFTAVVSTVVVYGQNEESGKESKLTFEAGSNFYHQNPDGSFINRLYKGVTAWHLDAELRAEEGAYLSDLNDVREIRFYGGAAFKDSVRNLNADTLIYYENSREALAIGNVLVTEGGRRLRADRVSYLKDIRVIRASGTVNVEDDSTRSTITGKEAVFNDSTGYGLIIGEPFLKKVEDNESIITVACRDSLEIFKNEKIIRLWNNVVATKDNLTMSCSDTLEIHDNEKSVKLWNNVVAVQDSLTANADHALYEDATETLTLTGSPGIQYVVTGTRDEALSTIRTVSIVNGDSVIVFIHDKKITDVRIIGSAVSTTTSTDTTGTLFDRSIIESTTMRLEMKDDFISLVSAEGTAKSYYHRNYKDEKKMFVNDASGDTLTFYFDRGKVAEMRIYGFGGGLGKGKYYDYEQEKTTVSDSTGTAVKLNGYR